MLAAILILAGAGGTLEIAPAIAAGEALPAAQLIWAVVGLLLAVWIKQGAWPLHFWMRAGRRLAPVSRIWLYGIVMPNLGMYLLYRVSPLLVALQPLRVVLFWLGVGEGCCCL